MPPILNLLVQSDSDNLVDSHSFAIQALRTLFNIAHRLHNVLGPSWVLVRQLFSLLVIR